MDILNVHMIRNLNLRLLRRGVGSMDYIHTRFAKLSVRVIYAGEIRNYREDNSTLEIFSQGCIQTVYVGLT